MPHTSRNRNRFADDRLWDDQGREWVRVPGFLTRDEVEHALADPAVRVGVHDDFGQPMQWIEPPDRLSFWRDHVEHNFADGGKPGPRVRRGERQPFAATLRESNG